MKRLSKPVLTWVHLPKCGGGTMWKLFENDPGCFFFPFDPWNVSQEEFEKGFLESEKNYCAIPGHGSWGLSKMLDIESFHAVMLRDPVERTISEFYFRSETTMDYIAPEYRLEKFREFVRSCQHLNYYCSFLSVYNQNRYFVKDSGMENKGLMKFCCSHGWLTEKIVGHPDPVSERFKKAEDALKTFDFIGDFAHYEDEVQRFTECFPFVKFTTPISKNNHTPNKPEQGIIDDELMDEIREKTSLDKMLYEQFAKG